MFHFYNFVVYFVFVRNRADDECKTLICSVSDILCCDTKSLQRKRELRTSLLHWWIIFLQQVCVESKKNLL